MTVMTDEAANKIAEKTLQKFEDAGKKAIFITVNDKGGQLCVTSGLDTIDVIEVCTNIMRHLSPSEDDFVYNLKTILKIVKKERKK